MPRYRYLGDVPKSLSGTTPPHDLQPGDEFEVEEEIANPEFLPVKGKPAAPAANED